MDNEHEMPPEAPNDGGPAYPAICDTEGRVITVDGKCGMSLRDYFAAAAICRTYIPMDSFPPDLMQLDDTRDTYAREVAREAYRIADAMLAERGN